MRRASLLLALASGLAVAAVGSAASAQVVAVPCAADPETCLSAPVHFEKTKAVLPLSGGFDTGWIPNDPPLQVRLAAGLWSETTVALDGGFETSWPEVLRQRAIGTPGGGLLSIHYGAEISADARVDFEVLGQHITWEGEIPGIPQFDFQVAQEQPFDPWAFEGFQVSGVTEVQTLAEISAADFIGIQFPGVDGGFRLNVQLDLDATYNTTSIVVNETDGSPVAEGPITSEADATRADYFATPFVEHDVHVEGSILYEGTFHLIPSLYLEFLGQGFDLPLLDVPVPFSLDDKDWIFDPVRVHTPIPDIDLPAFEAASTISFGDVEIGDERSVTIDIDNLGEHLLYVDLVVDEGVPVAVDLASVTVVQDGTAQVELTYAPTDEGELDAVLVLVSNDPDEPTRTLSLTGATVPLPSGSGGGEPTSSGQGGEGGAGGASEGGAGGAGGGEDDFIASGGGCDCTTSSSSPVGGAVGALAIAGFLAARRRRR